MTHQTPHASQPTIRIGDIYYVLFRHKWKILLIWLLGAGIASYLWFSGWEQRWMSQAKLLVKYVVETKTPTAASATEGFRNVEDSPIATEMEILSSVDLASEAARGLGDVRPDVIGKLSGAGAGTNAWELAVGQIRGGLKLDVPRRSSVIEVSFEHPDREVVRPVVQELIRAYLKRHVLIHQGKGLFDNVLKKETDQLKAELRRTEDRLREAKTKAGVVNLEDAKTFNMEQSQRIRQLIFDANTELAVNVRTIALLTAGRTGTNHNGTTELLKVPANVSTEYGRIRAQLDNMQRREQEFLVAYTPESKLVKELQQQMQKQILRKEELEAQYPSLAATAVESGPGGGRQDPLMQAGMATNAISVRLSALDAQMKFYEEDNKRLEMAESEIGELQRDRERQEQNFKYFSMTWDQTQANTRLREAGNASISEIQGASMPFRATTKRVKTITSILMGCIAGGLALAFALEFFVDRSFRRSVDVERQLGIPLFISIPRMKLNGKAKALPAGPCRMIADAKVSDGEGNGKPITAIAKRDAESAWKPSPALCPFAETLRDRLITYFEMKNLTHNPKLVAVTSCGDGAGVSTVSAGLAASLSETGEGNVLLVDMNMHNGAAHHFHRGELACNIDEVLEMDKRDGAMVQNKLYLASESSKNDGASSMMPQRFKNLVPKLKASDYDYIIFDMPPVSQISMTPRLAKFMDMVLMVVESEKTDRDVVKKATSLLAESKTNVGVVLNKARNYVPKALQQELT